MGNGESMAGDRDSSASDTEYETTDAGSVHSDDSEAARKQVHLSSATARRVVKKIRALAIFQRNRRKAKVSNTVKISRDDLHQFVRHRQQDKVQSMEEIENEDADISSKFRVRPTTPSGDDELHIIMPAAMGQSVHVTREKIGVCPVCSRAVTDGFPCRVCGQVYHHDCLLNSAQLSSTRLDRQLRSAHANIGWSCPTCDDLSSLLTAEELSGMIEDFERFDLNKDSGIVLHEYIDGKQRDHYRQSNEPMSELDLLRLRGQFQCMDINSDGVVAWWEFVKYEAGKRLAKRTKEELVKLLTPLEIASAQQHFNTFDDDGDGRITEIEVKKAYRSWYGRLSGQLGADKARPSQRAGDQDGALDLHAEHHSQLVFGNTEMNHGVITWEEFIKDQALYLITSRPNRAGFPKLA